MSSGLIERRIRVGKKRDLVRERLLAVWKGGQVKRFHTWPTIQTETVGHHSFMVAHLCDMLCDAPRFSLIIAALCHDLAEAVTGDIPSPVKRRINVKKIEEKYLVPLNLTVGLSESEERVLKLADIYSGMLFCVIEKSMGNYSIEPIYEEYESYLEDFKPFLTREQEIRDTLESLWAGTYPITDRQTTSQKGKKNVSKP